MLLFVGLFAFLSVLALHTYADSSGFTPPSTPNFSISDNKIIQKMIQRIAQMIHLIKKIPLIQGIVV